MEKLRYLWEHIKGSFWFIPVAMLIVSIIAAIFFVYLDDIIDHRNEGLYRFIFSGGVDSARSMLTIIAGAMIGVAGTVFSITLVALTLASSQLGPRLLRNFMYDKLNQVVLGTYVSAFIYCLVVSNTLSESNDFTFVPAISVFAALCFAIAGIVLLIFFIHHISVSIQSDKVVSDVSKSMSRSIRTLFPGQVGQESENALPDLDSLKQEYPVSISINCLSTGYLQSVDSNSLLDLASKEDIIINFFYRPGNYLVRDMTLCEVYCKKQCRPEINERINKAIISGKTRTPLQDAEFSIHQMVEIASRALSPGINDPYTAISCIDNLSAIYCYLAQVSFPSPLRFDKQGNLRLIAESLTFRGMLDTGLNQIRQNAESNPAVLIRILEALGRINRFAHGTQKKEDIMRHAEMVIRAAEKNFGEKNDLNDLRKRFRALTANKPFDEIK